MIYKDIAIQILFSIFLLSSTGIDNKSKNSEYGFVTSFATKNNIVSDVNKGQSEPKKFITHSFAENCPFCLNASTERFPTLWKNASSLEFYNLTDYKKKANLKAVRENLQLYGKKKIFDFLFLLRNINTLFRVEKLKFVNYNCRDLLLV